MDPNNPTNFGAIGSSAFIRQLDTENITVNGVTYRLYVQNWPARTAYPIKLYRAAGT